MMTSIFHSNLRVLMVISVMALCIYVLSQGMFFAENALVLAHLNPQNGITSCPPTFPLNANVPRTTISHPQFETGIVYMQWGQTAYGHCNQKWNAGLSSINPQTGARWIEMPIAFSQDTITSTQVTTLPTTPSVKSFQEGIFAAHALGYHVFVVPLIGVSTGVGRWSGSIHFTTTAQEQQWFNSYWQLFKPYVIAAQQAKADQLAIGTEDEWLERGVPSSMWNNFIANIHSIFSQALVYDTNWSSTSKSIPSWYANSNLSMIGVSEYIPLVDQRGSTPTQKLAILWKNRVGNVIDAFAVKVKKPVFLSEIGYRDSADALYNPWEKVTTAALSPQLQAAACDAALSNIAADPLIHGVFFWAWDNVDLFDLHDSSAANVIHKWYTSSQL